MIKIKNAFLLFLAVCLLSGLIKRYLMIYLIIFLHELGHLFFINLFKRTIKNIEVHPYGIIIDLYEENTNNYQDLLISFGGIMMNILLMPFLNNELREINLYILIFNSLPIYPLDGGLIIKNLLSYFIKYRYILYFLPLISIVFIIILFFNSFDNLNLFLVLIILLFRNIKEFSNKSINYQGFLINKYIKPNKKLKNRLINIKGYIKNFYKGFNNNIGLKDNYKKEEDILKDYYSK